MKKSILVFVLLRLSVTYASILVSNLDEGFVAMRAESVSFSGNNAVFYDVGIIDENGDKLQIMINYEGENLDYFCKLQGFATRGKFVMNYSYVDYDGPHTFAHLLNVTDSAQDPNTPIAFIQDDYVTDDVLEVVRDIHCSGFLKSKSEKELLIKSVSEQIN